MIEACNTIDGLDEFITLCEEHEKEMNTEAVRQLYRDQDFDCYYCLHFKRQTGCKYQVCPFTPDKVCCGCASLALALRFMAVEINNSRLTNRVNLYISGWRARKKNMMMFVDDQHRSVFYSHYPRLYHENAKLIAAVYLLSADKDLWNCVWRYVNSNDISFSRIKPKDMLSEAYTLLCVAKDLYLNTRHFFIAELADPIVIDPIRFRLILNAMGIRRYGYSFLQCRVGDMS